jgi:hypothetical protein
MSKRVIEGSSPCSAPAETVWQVWADPSTWPGSVIEVGAVDGEFAEGSKVTVKVKGGVKTASTLTKVEPPRIWCSVTKFPGLTLAYDHVIESAGSGTLLTERVTMTGPFAGLFDRMTRSKLEETFPAVTAEIARLAEARLPQ